MSKRFQIAFHYINPWQWSLGLHVDLRRPHVQLYVPTGFFTIGWWWTSGGVVAKKGPFILTSYNAVRKGWRS